MNSFSSKHHFGGMFSGIAEREESAQIHGWQCCHALQPSDLHRGQLMNDVCEFLYASLSVTATSIFLFLFFLLLPPFFLKTQQATTSSLKAVWNSECFLGNEMSMNV